MILRELVEKYSIWAGDALQSKDGSRTSLCLPAGDLDYLVRLASIGLAIYERSKNEKPHQKGRS